MIIIFLRASYEYDLAFYGEETLICRSFSSSFPIMCRDPQFVFIILIDSIQKKFGCQGSTYN